MTSLRRTKAERSDARTAVGSNQVADKRLITKVFRVNLVAGGGFDLCITHRLEVPMVLASLTRCPRWKKADSSAMD